MSDTPDSQAPSDEDYDGLRSSALRRSGYVVNASGDAVRVTYAVVDGRAILEGDIELGTAEDAEAFRRQVVAGGDASTQAIAILGEKFRWLPDGMIPYVIAPELPEPQRVHGAIAEWEARTPLRFPQWENQPDYLSFEVGPGCSSYVGRQGGKQAIRLAASCTAGKIAHEIGHAVGLWHEQSRADRDQFVTIRWENIAPEKKFNFNQQISNGLDLGGYDYGSLMHYPRTAFSINGQDTIVPVGGQPIGQRQRLSAGDIAGVKKLYPNLAWPANG